MNSLYKSATHLRLHTQLRISLRVARLLSASGANRPQQKPVEKIVLPKRIERGPTDILHALASTVGFDPTAPHFKYHDDPYLIPTSNISKKTYALAQEAGRKAAHWIRQENAKLFQHSEADPPIKAYVPTVTYTEDSQVEVTDLQQLIDNIEVKDAMLVYNLLKKNGIAVEDELKQQLLDLLCYFNHEDSLPEDYIEERWFRQGTTGKERQRKTWKDFELAEQIFHEIEHKQPEHYCALIRGMTRHFQVEKAWALYQETLEKGIPLDTNTFNSLLQVASFLKESYEKRWELLCDVLTAMKNQQLRPNLGTMNAVLQTITTIGGYSHPRTYALKILAEFRNLGVVPSLASWYYVLTIFCRERGPISHILHDILNEIEGKEFHIQDTKDTFFFVTAMDICRNHLQDKELAKRVDRLLHHADNYNLIGDSYKESIYYRHYFTLLCAAEPLEVFMDTYHKLVPNVYIPEPSVVESILQSVDVNGAIEHIPLLWSHMIQFDHVGRENLLNLLVTIMITNPPAIDEPRHAGLVERFCAIGWDMVTRLEERASSPRNTGTSQVGLSAQLLGDIMQLCCRANDFEKAAKIFAKLSREQQSQNIVGDPKAQAMREFVQLCIAGKETNAAIQCLQFCCDSGFPESGELGRTIAGSLVLNEVQKSKVKSLVGAEAMVASEKRE